MVSIHSHKWLTFFHLGYNDGGQSGHNASFSSFRPLALAGGSFLVGAGLVDHLNFEQWRDLITMVLDKLLAAFTLYIGYLAGRKVEKASNGGGQ